MNIADLRDEIVSPDAKAAFDVLVEGFTALGGLTLVPHQKGFVNALRILRGDDYCFSAIPNDEWVLAYVRKPEQQRGKLSHQHIFQFFPDARLTAKGEVTLRIRDAATATAWLTMIREAA